MIARVLQWLAGGALDRVLSTVDTKIKSDVDKEKLKAEIIKVHYETRGDWMRSGGLWLMVMFAAPLALWWCAVIVYSILWCQGCAYPQDWSIAALPSPLDEWSWVIVTAIFSVVGLDRIGKRK